MWVWVHTQSIMISVILDGFIKVSKPYFPIYERNWSLLIYKIHELICIEYLLNGTAYVLKVSKYTLEEKVGHNIVQQKIAW